jgi:hypothetical protein
MLKELINDCAEFNDKTNLKMKYKSWKKNDKQTGGNIDIKHFILFDKL